MTPEQFEQLQFRPQRAAPYRRENMLLFLFVLGAHILGVYCLAYLMQPRILNTSTEVQTTLVFLDWQQQTPAQVASKIVNVAKGSSSVSAAEPRTKQKNLATPVSKSTALVLTDDGFDQTSKPQILIDAYGRPRLPDNYIEEWEKQFGKQRTFDFQDPKFRDMEKLLERRIAIEYKPTRFDQAWRPEQDLLTDILERAVEKTTKEVKIKIPGVADGKLVCKISVLALGGGCGFVPNHGYQAYVDDPNTLNEEEARQCEAWWEKVIHAPSQSAWRQTRQLYEAECQKPLEKKRVMSESNNEASIDNF